MPTIRTRKPVNSIRLLLTGAIVTAVAIAALDADAQSRGMGRPSGGKPGWSGGGGGGGGWNGGGSRGSWSGSGGGNWNGSGGGNWNGSGGGGWHGGNHGHWNGGGHGHGYYKPYWRGYYGGHYYYPGWALGLGVGIGLTYPWWGWGWSYPYYGYYGYPSTVVYERVYDAPVGVVVERDGAAPSPSPSPSAAPAPVPAPSYRWYCPSPAGYHPEVSECPAGWLKVLPNGGPPPSGAPRSNAPAGDVDRTSPFIPETMGGATGTRLAASRIAAPRLQPPTQLARRDRPLEAIAQNAAQ